MLVFFAGKLGEAVIHGKSTLGNSNDHVRWLGVARSYLANHYRGMYYAEPQNKFEQEKNEAKRERDLNDKEALLLDGWTKNYPELRAAYRLKEAFYGIYEGSAAIAAYED
jgi:hypothetical protein